MQRHAAGLVGLGRSEVIGKYAGLLYGDVCVLP